MSSSTYTWTPSPVIVFRYFSLREIKDATDNFDENNVLGKGGSGKVYLAIIKLGPLINKVAVKHLHPHTLQNSREFMQEIKTISSIRHRNLVSIFGYCTESGKKIILEEYMEKGSLSDYVKKRSSISLSWLQRIRICLDAARGLQHLHMQTDEFPKGIIHCDVKPVNILLGKDWVAKMSESWIFKFSHTGQEQSTMITNLKGTCGYFAPEYLRYQSVTRKIDVYGFGVVLFQVLCQKMPWDRGDESYHRSEDEDFGIWAAQNVAAEIKEEILNESLKLFTALIGNTLKVDPRERPNMDSVVLELEKVLKAQQREDEAKKSDWHSTAGTSSRRNCKHISLDVVKQATNNFDESIVLGKGAESMVYLANIKLDWKVSTQVAVKHLHPNSTGFDQEIEIMSLIKSDNIVSLLGYCDDSGQKILIYEHMEKGYLSDYVSKNSSISLSWLQRLRICLDVARGLQHLHIETDEFPKGIIHRDVNLHNILLGKDWVAKISEFGMLKLSCAGQETSTMFTDLKGTRGYFAPEYIRYRSITRKADVYAFGVVLFQVLCLKYPWDRGDESYYTTNDEDLGIWAGKTLILRYKKIFLMIP